MTRVTTAHNASYMTPEHVPIDLSSSPLGRLQLVFVETSKLVPDLRLELSNLRDMTPVHNLFCLSGKSLYILWRKVGC